MHEPEKGEDLSEHLDLILVDPLYDLQRDVNENSMEYNLFASFDIKGIAKILRAVIKNEAHTHVYFSALIFVVQ